MPTRMIVQFVVSTVYTIANPCVLMQKTDQPSSPGACIEVTGPLGTVQVTIQDKVRFFFFDNTNMRTMLIRLNAELFISVQVVVEVCADFIAFLFSRIHCTYHRIVA